MDYLRRLINAIPPATKLLASSPMVTLSEVFVRAYAALRSPAEAPRTGFYGFVTATTNPTAAVLLVSLVTNDHSSPDTFDSSSTVFQAMTYDYSLDNTVV